MNSRIKFRIMGIVLSFFMVIGTVLPTSAETNYENALLELANSKINITEQIDEYGVCTTTYTSLDVFVADAKQLYPEISENELATFLLKYTGQDYEAVPEEEYLKCLSYDNITVSSSYVRVDQEGNSQVLDNDVLPYATWESTDGYMRITTIYSYDKTVGSKKYYVIAATAKWLNYPLVALGDAFALGTTGTFDSTYNEGGKVSQKYYCSVCDKTITKNRSVSSSDTSDGDLKMKYDSNLPSLTFTPKQPVCSTCNKTGTHKLFTAYLTYRIRISDDATIYAAYGHKTVGAGSIDVSYSDKKISFASSVVGTKITNYSARPVTITY